MALSNFEITIKKGEERIAMNKELAEKYLTDKEIKRLYRLLKKPETGKELNDRQFAELAFLTFKVEKALEIDEDSELSEEEKQLTKRIMELQELERKYKKVMSIFLGFIIGFVLLAIAVAITAVWYPSLIVVMDIAAIVLNIFLVCFLIYWKEAVIDWKRLGFTTKLIMWAAILVNMAFLATGIIAFL